MSDDKIISLADRRNAAEKPDPDCVRKDDFGREMFAYLCEYEMDGGSWSIDLWAYSMEDAQARVDAMRRSLVLNGQMMGLIPA